MIEGFAELSLRDSSKFGDQFEIFLSEVPLDLCSPSVAAPRTFWNSPRKKWRGPWAGGTI